MTIKDSIEKFYSKYPCCELQDVFKLVYQIYLGPGHLISSRENAEIYLHQECEQLDESVEEMLDYMNDEVIRVNLYPYLNNKGDISNLAEAFYMSQFYFEKDLDELIKVFTEIKGILVDYPFFDSDLYDDLLNELIETNFAPISHSQEYREIYRPHYRIIHKNTLNILGIV